jgi:hypothetical protein
MRSEFSAQLEYAPGEFMLSNCYLPICELRPLRTARYLNSAMNYVRWVGSYVPKCQKLRKIEPENLMDSHKKGNGRNLQEISAPHPLMEIY